MKTKNRILMLFALTLFLAGCGLSDAASGVTSMLPHHDHSSRRGGLVLMNGNDHFEVIVDFGGNHAVLFSDEYREPLPASAIQRATLTVVRSGEPDEALALQPGENGLWTVAGRKIEAKQVDVTVSYLRSGSENPYSIDLTIDAPKPAAHAHAHAHSH